MNYDIYLGKYVGQNAFIYALFLKRNLQAMRKLQKTLQWVGYQFESKDKKFMKNEYKHCQKPVLKNS